MAKQTNASVLKAREQEQISKSSALLDKQNELAAAKSAFFEFFGRYRRIGDISEAKNCINELEQNISRLKELKIAAEYASKGTNCKNAKQAAERLSLIKTNFPAVEDKAVIQEK